MERLFSLLSLSLFKSPSNKHNIRDYRRHYRKKHCFLGNFSAKSPYKLVQKEDILVDKVLYLGVLGRLRKLSKTSAHAWKILLGRIPERDNLQRELERYSNVK